MKIKINFIFLYNTISSNLKKIKRRNGWNKEISNETLIKKNKQLKAMQKLNENTKREYEEKIKI